MDKLPKKISFAIDGWGYDIEIEGSKGSFSACCPLYPGVEAVGKTEEDVLNNILEVLQHYLYESKEGIAN